LGPGSRRRKRRFWRQAAASEHLPGYGAALGLVAAGELAADDGWTQLPLGEVVGRVHRAPSDYPSGKQGDVLTVEFTVAGIPCLGLNGGPAFKHNEAFSFQIATDDQQETDRYWNAIVGNGGQESAFGWCKDKWASPGKSRRAC
jgi:hypothetical protein